MCKDVQGCARMADHDSIIDTIFGFGSLDCAGLDWKSLIWFIEISFEEYF